MLKKLEYLELHGKNELPNLDFIKELPNLKLVNLSMNVLDGDISCLQNIQYADVVCKRHYNLKNKDLPKGRTVMCPLSSRQTKKQKNLQIE